MCGIAGIHRRGTKPVLRINDLANALLLEIEPRGTDATGILALMHSGKVQLERRTQRASRFVNSRGAIHGAAKTVLLHTRFATVGRAEDPRNAHPVASGKVAAIHNGTIYNATELFAQHKLPRAAEVDSEIVAALVDKVGWDDAKDALAQFTGGAALGIIHTDHPDEVILARTRNYPLVYMVTEDVVIWASTAQAIERAWRKTYPRKPLGKMQTLLDWHMARVNGKVTVEKICPRPFTRSSGRMLPAPTSNRSKKKAAKRKRTSLPSVAGVHSGWVDGPDGYQYVGPAQAISYDELRSAGLSRSEAWEVLDDERALLDDVEDWRSDWEGDMLIDNSRRPLRGTIHTKSEATLAWEALDK